MAVSEVIITDELAKPSTRVAMLTAGSAYLADKRVRAYHMFFNNQNYNNYLSYSLTCQS
jgi:hypothetical protein